MVKRRGASSVRRPRPKQGIVVAGHICLDLTPTFRGSEARRLADILTPGALLVVGDCVVSTGGAVANTGGALARLGLDVGLMAKVGDDVFGRAVVDKVKEFASARGLRVARGESTSYTVVISPPGVDRVFLHNPGTNDTFGADDIDYDAVARAGVFHFGYPPLMRRMYSGGGEELALTMRRAKEAGAITSLDLALPDPDSEAGRADWDAILRKTLPHVDLFVPSIEEVLYCLDRGRFLAERAEAKARGVELLETIATQDFSRLAGVLLGYGALVVMLKAGRRGIYARTAARERLARSALDPETWADRELWMPPFVVEKIASATGAGDCAIAGFLAGVAKGEGLESCLAYAAACGAENLSAYDATSGVKSWSETTRMLKGWRKVRIELGGDWRFDEEAGLWRGPSGRS